MMPESLALLCRRGPRGVVLRGAVRGRTEKASRGGVAGSRAGWCREKPCGVVLRKAVRGGPEGCDGRRPFYIAATGSFMRVSLQRFPSLPPEIRNHCSIWADSGEILASIPKSGPEIKNHCSIWADSEENLASIPKSGPEIKNHCRDRAILEVFPAAISKFTP